MTTYDRIHPDDQLAMLDAEAGHLRSLQEGAAMWVDAMSLIAKHVQELTVRQEDVAGAWQDPAGRLFVDELRKSVERMAAGKDVIFDSGVHWRMTWLPVTHGAVREAVRQVCERYKAICDAGENSTAQFLAHCAEAGMHTAKFDHEYLSLVEAMRTLRNSLPRWYGPLAAAGGTGDPGVPGGATSSATTGGAAPTSADPGDPVPAAPQSPVDVPEPVTAGGQPDLSEVLGAATDALGAMEGLLGGGAQVPDPISPEDLGLGEIPHANHADYADYADYPPGGMPALAGLDAGVSAGGVGGGGVGGLTSVTGPGTGGAAGAGTAPVPSGFATTASGRSAGASTPMTPPMHPPNAGAGTGRAGGAIKPGDSDRPAARPRPRATGRPVTPGVALTGRAGAAAPKPAARREWDSENDSLQVLDENLWQVNPQEEETHGQSRRGPGRDGRDRTGVPGATDAGLVGPGGRADQPARAR